MPSPEIWVPDGLIANRFVVGLWQRTCDFIGHVFG